MSIGLDIERDTGNIIDSDGAISVHKLIKCGCETINKKNGGITDVTNKKEMASVINSGVIDVYPELELLNIPNTLISGEAVIVTIKDYNSNFNYNFNVTNGSVIYEPGINYFTYIADETTQTINSELNVWTDIDGAVNSIVTSASIGIEPIPVTDDQIVIYNKKNIRNEFLNKKNISTIDNKLAPINYGEHIGIPRTIQQGDGYGSDELYINISNNGYSINSSEHLEIIDNKIPNTVDNINYIENTEFPLNVGDTLLTNNNEKLVIDKFITNFYSDIKKIVMLDLHNTIYLMNDGTVYCYGDDTNGCLDISAEIMNNNNNIKLLSINNVSNIFYGGAVIYFLKSNGELWGAGNDYSGILGINSKGQNITTITYLNINNVKTVNSNIISNTVVVKQNGEVWTVGDNSYGQLGDGTTNDSGVWVKANIDNAIDAITGDYNLVVNKNDNTIWVIGRNRYGQLGVGNSNDITIFTNTNITDAASIACNGFNTLYLSIDGNVYMSGYDLQNIFGDGNGYLELVNFTKITLPDNTICNEIKSAYGYAIIKLTNGKLYGCGDSIGYDVYTKILDISVDDYYTYDNIIFYKNASGNAFFYSLIDGYDTTYSYPPSVDVYDIINNGLKIDNILSTICTGIIPKQNLNIIPTALYNLKDYDIVPSEYVSIIDNTNISTLDKVFIDKNIYNPRIGDILKTDYNYKFTVNSYEQINVDTITYDNIITANAYNTFIVTQDHNLYSIGNNTSGILGNGNEIDQSYLTKSNIDNVISVSSSTDHTLILNNEGKIWGVGKNSTYGLLGNSSAGDSVNWITENSFIAKQVIATKYNSYALDVDGYVWGVGSGAAGQLGTNTNDDILSWTKLQVDNVKKIIANDVSLFVIKNDGTLYKTGNTLSTTSSGIQNSNVFVSLGFTNVVDVAIGNFSIFVLKSDNTISGIGSNYNGQLGVGNSDNQNTWVDIPLTDVKKIYSINEYSIALKNDGSIWGTGRDLNNILNLGGTYNTVNWVMIHDGNYLTIAGSTSHLYAIDSNGSIYGMGANYANQRIGIDSLDEHISSLVKIPNLIGKLAVNINCYAVIPEHTLPLVPTDIYGLIKFSINDVVPEINKNILLDIDYDNQINSVNILNTIVTPVNNKLYYDESKYTPSIGDINIINNNEKVTVNGTSSDNYIVDKIFNNFLITTDNLLWYYGSNSYGQLGDGTTTDKLKYSASELLNVVKVYGSTYGSSTVLTSDGYVYISGDNEHGIFGNGTTDNSTTWVKVDITGIVDFATDGYSSYLLKNDGTVWCAGGNILLGDNTSPAELNVYTQNTITDVAKIFIGNFRLWAIKNDNTIWVIGDADNGGFGDGVSSGLNKEWVNITTLSNIVDIIDTNDTDNMALDTDGNLWRNMYSEDGGNTYIQTWTKSNINNVNKIVSGYDNFGFNLVLKNDGTLLGLGHNNNSEIADLNNGGETYYREFITVDTNGLIPVDISTYDTYTVIKTSDNKVYHMGGGVGTFTEIQNNFNNGIPYITIDETLTQIPTAMYETLDKYYNNQDIVYDKKVNTRYLLYTDSDVTIGDKMITNYNERFTVTEYDKDLKLIKTNEPLLNIPERLYWYNDYIPGEHETPFKGLRKISSIEDSIEILDSAGYSKNTVNKLFINSTIMQPSIDDKFITNNGEVFTADIVNSGRYNFDNSKIKNIIGNEYFVGIIDNNNDLWFRGFNSYGKFGIDGNINEYVSWTKSNINNVVQIVDSYETLYALKSNGEVYGIGSNDHGQLGDGTTNDSSVWVRIGTSLWKSIHSATSGLYLISTSYELFAIGNNDNNMLGIDTGGTDIHTPTTLNIFANEVIGIPILTVRTLDDHILISDFMNDSTNIIDTGIIGKEISGSLTNIFVVTTDNELYGFGDNSYGQLGDGTTNDVHTFVKSNITNVKHVYCGNYNAHVIKTDGTIYSIGLNNYGQLCTGDTIDSNTYTEITNYSYVNFYTSGHNTYVIKDDMSISLFGSELYSISDTNTSHITEYQLGGPNIKNLYIKFDNYIETNTPVNVVPKELYPLSTYTVNNIDIIPNTVKYINGKLNILYDDVTIPPSYTLDFKMVQNKFNTMTNFSGLVFK